MLDHHAPRPAPAAPRSPQQRVPRLLALGIDDTTALQLLTRHLPAQIDCALDNAAFLASRGRLANAAGYVIDALRRNYPAIPERLEAQRRDKAQRRARKSQAAQHERETQQRQREARDAAQAQARVQAFIAALDPQAREELKQRTLAAQPTSVRAALAGSDPQRSRNLASLMHACAAAAASRA